MNISNKKQKTFYCFFLLCLLTFPLLTKAQGSDGPPMHIINTDHIPKRVNVVECTATTLNGNLVFNAGFATNQNYNGDIFNPFAFNYVDYWSNAFSTPNFDFGTSTPPFPGIHAAFMGSTYAGGQVYSEGLIGKLSPLSQGQPYSLSFYLNYYEPAIASASHAYNIYLMHCSDAPIYFQSPNTTFLLPPMPPHSQRIFCETNGGSTAWRQLSICFTPDENYDMILIFPAVTPAPSTPEYTEYIGFAYPELISRSSSDFSIVVTDADQGNPCIKTLSPSYAVTNATYQWFLNGNLFSTLQNPQINATTQYGTISVQVTLPNAGSNSTCGQQPCNLTLTATIEIPLCQGCPPSQTVKIADEASQISGLNVFPYTISQNEINVVCYRWEWDDRIKLKSSFSSGNTWYFNNYQIPNSWINYQDEYLTLSRCPNQNIPDFCQESWDISPIEIRVSNPNSCNGMSAPIYLVFNPLYLSDESIVGVHPGQTSVVNLFNYGSNSNYIWQNNYPGVTITPINSNWSIVSIFVPLSYANTVLSFPIDITNQWCTSSMYNNTSAECSNFCLTNFIGKIYVWSNIADPSSIKIYPNPATTQVKITSTEPITNIEISDLMNPTLKRIKLNNTKSAIINVTDLKAGVYNCKITTSKGTENQKIIIKR